MPASLCRKSLQDQRHSSYLHETRGPKTDARPRTPRPTRMNRRLRTARELRWTPIVGQSTGVISGTRERRTRPLTTSVIDLTTRHGPVWEQFVASEIETGRQHRMENRFCRNRSDTHHRWCAQRSPFTRGDRISTEQVACSGSCIQVKHHAMHRHQSRSHLCQRCVSHAGWTCREENEGRSR